MPHSHVKLGTVKFSENLKGNVGGIHTMKLKMIMASFIAAAAIMLTTSIEDYKVEASTNEKYIASEYLTAYSYQFLGTRYVYGGTTTSGFDCSGYVRHIYKQFGVNLPRTSSAMFGQGQSVAKSNLQVGDLVFFKTTAATVGHVGIYIGNGNFVHSSTGKGVIITKLNDPYYWGKRYVGAKRVGNVASLSTIVASSK